MTPASLAQDSEFLLSHREDGASDTCSRVSTVLDRSVRGEWAILKLSDGSVLESRRFVPVGRADSIRHDGDSIAVYAKRDRAWIELGPAWSTKTKIELSGIELVVTFKEIETAAELNLFRQLKQFHYRGGGGAGRILPMIGTVEAADLPRVIGFVELTSSMIANTARKRFFDGPYREAEGVCWNAWDRAASRELSSLVCRISRFVIHPELRGLGLARHFAKASIAFASERWHYGGYRPRFLEITADMLRYYPFVSEDFAYIGETEGNEHRVSKDMNYLVRRALTDQGVKAMPQGGGGIMALQRGYATTLLDYIRQTGAPLEEAVAQLQYDPSVLDQQSWEKLHRLNRRPKPCYIAGLTKTARDFVQTRSLQTSPNAAPQKRKVRALDTPWQLSNLRVDAEADIVQSRDGRLLQDAFGFVGTSLGSTVVPPLDLTLAPGQISLICGASGAGKSLLLAAVARLLQHGGSNNVQGSELSGLKFAGTMDRPGHIASLAPLDPNCAPLDLLGTAPLGKMLMLAARCGLAEPQLLVRPIWTLSSGQKYRLQIALTLLSDPQIILIDNFCEALDRFSTRAVCKGLTTLIRELNVAAVLATAAYDRLSECLEPDQIVMLRRGDEPVIRKGTRLEI